MPEKFDLEAMEEGIRKRLHPPARTGNLIERFREATRKRKQPKLPKI